MFPLTDMRWAAVAMGSVFVLTVLTGTLLLPRIRRAAASQPIRHNGPKSHFKKAGTPTFGGSFFLIPIVLSAIVAIAINVRYRTFLIMVVCMLLYGVVGFFDDFIKVRVSKKGLSVRQKTVFLGLISVLIAVYAVWLAPVDPFIIVPFTARRVLIVGPWKIVYAIILVPFLFYMGNAVNLTDGIDGLLSSVMTVATLGLFVTVAMLAPFIPDAASIMMLLLAIAGGCLGFLCFNHYPAKIFMGDTGSQALGIGFAVATVLSGMPYLAIITGFVFFFEGLSVVMQVLYFRATGGKRIFRMSPIHHHFELGGWSERKIVRVFSVVGLVAAAIGFAIVARPLGG